MASNHRNTDTVTDTNTNSYVRMAQRPVHRTKEETANGGQATQVLDWAHHQLSNIWPSGLTQRHVLELGVAFLRVTGYL